MTHPKAPDWPPTLPAAWKCYPITSDFKNLSIVPVGGKQPVWHVLDRLSGNLYVLSQTQGLDVRYAPLLIHHFALCAPRKVLDATKFQQRYHRYEEIENVPDRLRWCRYSRGLTQAEVAELAGVTCAVYMDIEQGITQHIPQTAIEKLADFYSVPITDFMDAYNRFLYSGQAEMIRAYRMSLGLGTKPFARKMGIPIRSLQQWQSGQKTISRQSWEKYFGRRG